MPLSRLVSFAGPDAPRRGIMVQPLRRRPDMRLCGIPCRSRAGSGPGADGVVARAGQCRTAFSIVLVTGVASSPALRAPASRATGLDPDTRHQQGSAMLFKDTVSNGPKTQGRDQ